MTKKEFAARLSGDLPLILDGATGSNLRAAGMPVGVSTELWAEQHPDVLVDLQRRYAEAGSEVVYVQPFRQTGSAWTG